MISPAPSNEPHTVGGIHETSASSAAGTLVRDSLLVAPGYVIPGIVSLIGVPVLFGLLGAANYGIWALMNSIASGVPPLATSSVEALTLRYGHRSDGGFRLREWVVSIGASAGIGAALAWIFVPDASTAVVAITGSLAVAISVYLLWMARLQSALRFAAVSAVASIRAVVGLALAVAAAMATGSPSAAVAGLATGISVAVIASAIVTNGRQGPRTAVANHAQVSTTGRLSFGLGSLVVAVGLFELSVGDRFVMATFSQLSELGTYAAVYTIEDLILRFLPAVVLVALRPRLFRAWDATNQRRAATGMVGIAAIILWVGLGLTSGIVALGPALGLGAPVDRLIGPIALGLSASMAASGLSLIYTASERQWRLAAHVTAAASLNICLNLLLVPTYGAFGAALATAVSFSTLLALHALGLGRLLNAGPAVTILAFSSLAATILVGLGSGSSQDPIWFVFGLVATIVLVPFVVLTGRSTTGHVR